jgi:hypothetical protein
MKAARHRTWGIAAAVTTGVVMLTVLLVAANDAGGPDCDAFAFDRGEWLALRPFSDLEDVGPAHEIAQGLDECGRLEGLSRSSVARMLGAPRTRSATGSEWSYDLGAPEGTSDNGMLVVEYGTGGTVRDVSIWHVG